MSTRVACVWLLVNALGACRPAPEQRSPPAVNTPTAQLAAPAATHSTTNQSSAVPQTLAAEPACNPLGDATVFLARSPLESQALRERLAVGPVAVRLSGCKAEFLSCQVSGGGTFAAAPGCCASDAGCRGNRVDCYATEERYWFGTPVEWQLNLPEMLPLWSVHQPAALVVGAIAHEEYRAARAVVVDPSCTGATHVITRARFGSLRIEAEAARPGQAAPKRTTLVAAEKTDTLIDLVLTQVTGHANETCPAPTSYRWTSEPRPFEGQRYRALPGRCFFTCTKDSPHCSCAAGFGQSCAFADHVDLAELQATCDHGGDQSALACGKLSTLLSGEDALKFALIACERGREQCARAAELLAAQNLQSDPRFERALRFACASSAHSCCDWGNLLLTQNDDKRRARAVLTEYCAEWFPSCCATLRSHGYPVPPRRFRPD